MIRLACASVILFAFVLGPAAAEPKRQLDAHDHGHGTLNIAIEGKRIRMELEVPGADIVGFEHAAKSVGDKAKVKAAEKTLSSPLSLFVLPDAAGCKVKSSDISVLGEEHDVHAAHDHRSDRHNQHADEKSHSEFHGEWTLTCANIDAITTMKFPYFTVFPGAEELEVKMISKNSQKAFKVGRDKAVIDLRGII
ncbi:MAG: DUF2796 domain-containing protein [Hyphomicrobiales bacterium]|nr:DUF2796 domain-containing protein [Hyphomicrobiales bacterium]